MRNRWVVTVLAGGFLLTACAADTAAVVDENGDVPELPAPAEGPVPDLPVTPEAAADSPLPQVTVRQVNGDGGFAQLKNALPSDKPLLVWFWAPH